MGRNKHLIRIEYEKRYVKICTEPVDFSLQNSVACSVLVCMHVLGLNDFGK